MQEVARDEIGVEQHRRAGEGGGLPPEVEGPSQDADAVTAGEGGEHVVRTRGSRGHVTATCPLRRVDRDVDRAERRHEVGEVVGPGPRDRAVEDGCAEVVPVEPAQEGPGEGVPGAGHPVVLDPGQGQGEPVDEAGEPAQLGAERHRGRGVAGEPGDEVVPHPDEHVIGPRALDDLQRGVRQVGTLLLEQPAQLVGVDRGVAVVEGHGAIPSLRVHARTPARGVVVLRGRLGAPPTAGGETTKEPDAP